MELQLFLQHYIDDDDHDHDHDDEDDDADTDGNESREINVNIMMMMLIVFKSIIAEYFRKAVTQKPESAHAQCLSQSDSYAAGLN